MLPYVGDYNKKKKVGLSVHLKLSCQKAYAVVVTCIKPIDFEFPLLGTFAALKKIAKENI